MGSQFSRSTSDEARFVKAIKEAIEQFLPRGLVLPVMQDDPPEEDPTNLWMRADGRLRGRYWDGANFLYVDYPVRSDITSPPAVPAAPPVPAKPDTPITHQSLYTATWSQTYQGSGAQRTDTRGEQFIVFGNEGNTYGTMRSLVGFNYAVIAADLAGSTIKSVALTMQNIHSEWPSGVEVFFGLHNVTSEPASWPASGDLPLRRVTSAHFGRPEVRTIALPMTFGQHLRAGTAKGLAIEAPTDSRDYYGYAAGVGSGYSPPQLVITYIK